MIAIVVIGAGVFGYSYLGGALTAGSKTTSMTGTSTTTSGQTCNEQVYNTKTELTSENVPVLLMQPGTTGYICVTYQTAWQGNVTEYQNSSIYRDAFANDSYQFSMPIGTENCSASQGVTSCIGVPSYSFDITASPSSIQPTGAMNFVTVVYTVDALSNATGFYDYSAPYMYCSGMPMAVGYGSAQVNASDFAPLFVHPCPFLPFAPAGVSVGGMGVEYIPFGQSQSS
jgi:hypothetical protein